MNGIAVNQIGFYPRPWGSNQGVVNCLPSRPIPPNFGFPNGTMESNLAAQYLFQNSSQQNLYFPFHTNRSPLLVIFRELNNPNRIIKVLGFHAPPDAGQAQIAINRISQIHEIQNPSFAIPIEVFMQDYEMNPMKAIACNGELSVDNPTYNFRLNSTLFNNRNETVHLDLINHAREEVFTISIPPKDLYMGELELGANQNYIFIQLNKEDNCDLIYAFEPNGYLVIN